MNRDVLQAIVIDNTARILALQSTFLGYLREEHSEEFVCDVMMNLYENHVVFLKNLSVQLPDKPYNENVAEILIKKSLEAQKEKDYWRIRKGTGQ